MAEGPVRIVMLVDAEQGPARLITSLAAREGWETVVLRDASETPPLATGAAVRSIWLDVPDARPSIAGAIHELRARTGAASVIVSCESRARAILALREGADDVLIKPVTSERVVAALHTAERASRPGYGPAPLSAKGAKDDNERDFGSLVATAPVMQPVLAAATAAAQERGPLLVSGEPGTGKDRLIRAIHGTGPRSRAPLRLLNAALVPPSAIESRLFGHEKNAFAGAFDRATGTIQQSDGGTIAIDEIEHLALPLQQRLLEFLREGAVRPIGSVYGQRVDVRLIAATNTDLRTLADTGRFLPELLDMLAAATVELPPLRERCVDIVPLARHFLSRFGALPGVAPVEAGDAALAVLAHYDWPGNVRQLHSTLLRAAILSDGAMLTPADFPALEAGSSRPREVPSPRAAPVNAGVALYTADGNLRPLDQIEGDVIRLAISHYRGRMTEVARRLGIGRSTLYRKLSELGIDNAA